ncbi:MAG TPA: efflux RND transporter permease subunit, partial [Planctomycetaceae bacterium]|nr:efflux RND transporter permease subunit [Planctomycetaceae bacterium]
MNLTRLAVNRPVTTLMGSLFVVLLGAVSLSRLSVDLMPDLEFPTVTVSTIYRGAGPEEIETLLTRPLEQVLSGVSGVERVSSTSMEGSSSVRVEFDWGTDLDAAIGDMRQAIQQITPNFPEEVEDPYIRRYDISDQPIMYLSVNSELPGLEVSQMAEQTIIPQFERLDGVARVRLRGHTVREIQVNLLRTKLEALDMGVNEVVEALRLENVNQPAGDFEEGHLNLLIRSRGEYRNLQQIRDTVIRESAGAVVRVSDVAEVLDGEEERTELTRTNGEPGIMVYIYKQAGANTIDVSDSVIETVDRLNGTLRSAQLTVRLDKSEYIRDAIANVKRAALLGMGLAVVVLILFLHSFRSTLVIAISIPLSVLFTFVLIYYNGFTLNMVSFGGLALGIGMLVDNSIVVLENIYRHQSEGLPPREAAIVGTQEVSSAITASTLTTLIVFVPMLFIQGTTGVLLHQLAAVVAYSLLCSLFASLTLTPVLAAYWGGGEPAGQGDLLSRAGHWIVERFHGCTRKFVGAMSAAYQRLLELSLRYWRTTSFALLLAFCTTLGLWPLVGTEFLPQTDEGSLFVSATMAPGIQLATLDRQSRKIEQAILTAVPESEMMSSFIGDGSDEANDWNEGRFIMRVSPRSQRDRSIEEIRKTLAQNIGQIPGATLQVRAFTDNGMSRMLRSRGSGDGGTIVVEIRGHDRDTARELATLAEEKMKSIAGLINVKLDRRNARPELSAEIDRSKAGYLGVRAGDITQALETTIRGTEATVFREDGFEFNVLVRLREEDRNRIADIQQVGITTPLGRVVPLKTLVDFHKDESDVEINRLDRQRIVSISAEVEDRDLGSVVKDLQDGLNALPTPDGFTINIAGDWEEQQEAFQALLFGFVLALVMMYMVMASQFESLRDPLLILCSVPLGAIGVILMLVLTGTTLNVQSYIGMVILAGIVVNNAIVLIDCINQIRRDEPELPLRDVLMKAGGRRFRPIIMTTLTTVLAMLPISMGWGEGGELQAPMARVVVGGLTSATLITLFAIP